MEPPPTASHIRRRKKRSSGGGNNGYVIGGPLGTSLTGLRRNNIRVVELVRRPTGYGFTISGQKPCLLRSIIDGSPAALAGLRKGHCLIGVNGREVTHLAHDEVVQIIGKSTGFLRLHVVDSYFSESSDDEALPPRLRSPSSLHLPLPGNRRLLRRDPITNVISYPTALRHSKVSPRRAAALGYCFPPTPPVKKTVPSLQLPKQPLPLPSDDDFETDPNSMNEILRDDRDRHFANGLSSSHPGKVSILSRFSLNGIKQRQRRSQGRIQPPESDSDVETPRPLEVSVIITSSSPRKSNERQDRRRSMDGIGRTSTNSEESECQLNSSALYPPMHQLSVPVSCTRNSVTRSLDNLCSPDILDSGIEGSGCAINARKLEKKGNIGSSTPSLLHEVLKPIGDQFWEFKVPKAPKPNSEANPAKRWAESVEKLLSDLNGLEVFTEFLEHEFSAENIHFYTACLQYKESFPNLTNSQRISIASTIFQKHLQNGATDPVNVDHQARNAVEKALPRPTFEMFDLPLSQVFNLLKFDCYPRFLKSDTYRDHINGTFSVQSQGEVELTDSDADSIKSQSKLNPDGRRKSLLPWNIKNRSKKKQRNKDEEGLSSDMSFIQRTALSHGAGGETSDQDADSRRQSCKVCRVVLPDGSTTVLPCKPGESLSTVVQRLLEKREFPYSAFEVISVRTGKAIDLNTEASGITTREIRVEPRAFIGIELPLGWKVGIRANPARKMAEILKPILAQHSLKLDNIVIHDLETRLPVELKCPVGKVDGRNLSVETKGDIKSEEEFTTHITEFPPSETHQFFDDDQLSAKTASSQSSSVFKDFLRRSSKKYKREMRKLSLQSGSSNATSTTKTDDEQKEQIPEPPAPPKSKSSEFYIKLPPKFYSKRIDGNPVSTATVSDARSETSRKGLGTMIPVPKNPTATTSSPLSLIHAELNLTETSRNRKPIYVNQTVDNHKS